MTLILKRVKVIKVIHKQVKVYKNMKRCSNLIVITHIQITAKMTDHYMEMRSGKLGKLGNARCQQEWRYSWAQTHRHYSENGDWWTHAREQFGSTESSLKY